MLVVCLFSSIALAEDGNMGSGGRSCPSGTTSCRAAEQSTDNDTNQTESILDFIRGYLVSIFE